MVKTRRKRLRRGPKEINWDPGEIQNGAICLNCGAANPDGGDKCGSCGEDPSAIPEGKISAAQAELLVKLKKMRQRNVHHSLIGKS